tara:strand:- start:1548 stop:1853 length:306 start_codon:yes stop_codon:yes gene_type:complete
MPLPTQEFLNDWLEDEMPIEIRKRETIKEFRRYKKLSIKTKLRNLKKKLDADLYYLYKKYNMDIEIIEQGGHPEIGFETNLPSVGLSDIAFNTLYKSKMRK